MTAASARLELIGMTKDFPGVRACDGVDFAVAPGSIHALLGENGSGKSTVVKMVYGVLRPDAGTILWNGRETTVADPRAARAMGVGMVFQHFSLFDALTALENIALGFDEAVPAADLERRVGAILDQYGLHLDMHRRVHDLSAGERQRIEIVRALLRTPQLLIMDEPTSVLTPGEADTLFDSLRTLVRQGCSILYISHKLREVQALCDDATILRAGRVVARCDPRSETSGSLAAMMIGADAPRPTPVSGRPGGAARLTVNGLGGDDASGLKDVSFSVAGGEILGVAGIAGNGQNALLSALTGEAPARRADAIVFDGQPVGRLGPEARRALGLRGLPEERNGHAAVGDLTLAENAILTGRGRFAAGGLVDFAAAAQFASEVIARFQVKTTGAEARAGGLSGGNLQRFVVGREILAQPKALVIDQPTWGVDAGAAAAIHQALIDLAADGAAIVLVSQDLDELLALCHRLAVIQAGRLSDAFDNDADALGKIGLLMGDAADAA